MLCWYMFKDTAVRSMTIMYMWLTNIGSFWIISIQIGHSAGIAGIIQDMWNLKSILVTNLFWVTWSPGVSRWRIPFCFTVKSYTLLYNNNIYSGWNLPILAGAVHQVGKWKIKLKNSIYSKIHLSDLSSIATVKGSNPTSTLTYKRVFFI